MKKTRFELSAREQKVMDLFWASDSGLTSVDILEQLSDIMPNPTYVHRTITTLLEKKFIKECGSVRYNKQYARKFSPTLTREEYATGLLMEKGLDISSLNKIAMAFIKHSAAKDSTAKETIINELQNVIEQLTNEL